jgi:hypothetical protein
VNRTVGAAVEEDHHLQEQALARDRPRATAGAVSPANTGAGGDGGSAKMQTRREISASSYDDRSHMIIFHPHP